LPGSVCSDFREREQAVVSGIHNKKQFNRPGTVVMPVSLLLRKQRLGELRFEASQAKSLQDPISTMAGCNSVCLSSQAIQRSVDRRIVAQVHWRIK
jgi:hypothetical protein